MNKLFSDILSRLDELAHENKCNCRPCQLLRKNRLKKLEVECQGLRAAIEKLQSQGIDLAKVTDLH